MVAKNIYQRKPRSTFGALKPPLELPKGWTFVCDSNEHAGPHCGYQLRNPVDGIERKRLFAGDYTVRDPTGFLHDHEVCIERKTLMNLLQDVGQGRERMDKFIPRFATVKNPLIVIESSWELAAKPYLQHAKNLGKFKGSKVSPNSVIGSSLSWMLRHRIPWVFAENAFEGERVTRWYLAKYAQDVVDREKTAS